MLGHGVRNEDSHCVRRATGGYLGNRVIEVMMPHITYERDAAEIYLRQYRGQ